MNEMIRKTAQYLKRLMSSLSTKVHRLKVWFQERQKERENQHASKFSLGAFFEGQPLAFEDMLKKSWEYHFTRFLFFLSKRYVRKKITALSSDLAGINCLSRPQPVKTDKGRYDWESGDWIRSPDRSAHPRESLSACDPAYINYHSVCWWYYKLRNQIPGTMGARIFFIFYILALASASFWLLITMLVVGNDQVIDFTSPSGGSYKLQVTNQSTQNTEYSMVILDPDESVVTPDFSQLQVWPIIVGQKVLYETDDQMDYHLYSIESTDGNELAILIYPWSTDLNTEFTLLDHEFHVCDSVAMSTLIPDGHPPVINCNTLPGQIYYLRVSSPGDLTEYSFSLFEIISPPFGKDSTIESEVWIQPGTYFQNQLGSNQDNWFSVDLQKEQRLSVWLFITNAKSEISLLSDISMLLYELSPQGNEIVTFNKPYNTTSHDFPWHSTSISSIDGLAYYLAYLGNGSRFSITVEWAEAIPIISLFIIVGIPLILILVVLYYIKGEQLLSPSRYQESAAVMAIVQVLKELDNDQVLTSDHLKAKLRGRISKAASDVYRIHRIYQFPAQNFSPGELRFHLDNMSSQVEDMSKQATIPKQETLEELRIRFMDWLCIFVKSEYGEFRFQPGFVKSRLSWVKRLYLFISRHMLINFVTVILLAILGLITRQLWTPYSEEIASTAWYITRCLALVISVDFIYHRWGLKPIEKGEGTRWEYIVRAILFFVAPFVFLDILLQTGLVEALVSLLSGLSIF
jgi:hypothetical protein